MVKVRARAEMIGIMEWVGEVPDDIPEDERWLWIKENVCGSHYVEIGSDWENYPDVLVLNE